jgi:hypothetical protein
LCPCVAPSLPRSDGTSSNLISNGGTQPSIQNAILPREARSHPFHSELPKTRWRGSSLVLLQRRSLQPSRKCNLNRTMEEWEHFSKASFVAVRRTTTVPSSPPDPSNRPISTSLNGVSQLRILLQPNPPQFRNRKCNLKLLSLRLLLAKRLPMKPPRQFPAEHSAKRSLKSREKLLTKLLRRWPTFEYPMRLAFKTLRSTISLGPREISRPRSTRLLIRGSIKLPPIRGRRGSLVLQIYIRHSIRTSRTPCPKSAYLQKVFKTNSLVGHPSKSIQSGCQRSPFCSAESIRCRQTCRRRRECNLRIVYDYESCRSDRRVYRYLGRIAAR